MTNDLVPIYPQPPAQVALYVEILGIDLTIDFLLAFGGAGISIPVDPKGKSHLEALVGYEKAKRLGENLHLLQRRVPLAKQWTAQVVRAKGHSISDIARRLHVTDVSVRGWLK
ncbi:MAG: helix-turn-helix domain containing protein [Rhodobacteraceae bacterium]|nr:helix-turn-helix domain containing protein [Paracoccaceae bacterium]